MSSDIIVLRHTVTILQRTLMLPKNLKDENFGMWYYVKFILLNISTSGMLAGTVMHFGKNIKGSYM